MLTRSSARGAEIFIRKGERFVRWKNEGTGKMWTAPATTAAWRWIAISELLQICAEKHLKAGLPANR
jgi:hypothetical protein